MLPPDLTTITGGLSLLLIKIKYEIKITLNELVTYIYKYLSWVRVAARTGRSDPMFRSDPSGGRVFKLNDAQRFFSVFHDVLKHNDA